LEAALFEFREDELVDGSAHPGAIFDGRRCGDLLLLEGPEGLLFGSKVGGFGGLGSGLGFTGAGPWRTHFAPLGELGQIVRLELAHGRHFDGTGVACDDEEVAFFGLFLLEEAGFLEPCGGTQIDPATLQFCVVASLAVFHQKGTNVFFEVFDLIGSLGREGDCQSEQERGFRGNHGWLNRLLLQEYHGSQGPYFMGKCALD
jgi:hypothetical protein